VDTAVANLVVAAALAGLIWTIQVVHYPLFARVGPQEWPRYEAEHQRRITWLVGPLMVANVVLAVALLLAEPDVLSAINAGLAVAVFIATGLIYAPMHGGLQSSAGEVAIRRLVRANWARTAAWTVQVAVAVALV
jgi:uncharacterized membrane protein